NGVEVNDHFFPVLPLARSAVKITVSSVPPFVRDEVLTRELSRYGKVFSRVTKVSSGCKSPLLRHVVSHRRQLRMTLNNSSRELNVVFRVDVDGFDYVVYASTDDFRCFNCGKEGHQSKVCPERTGSHKDQNQLGTERGRGRHRGQNQGGRKDERGQLGSSNHQEHGGDKTGA
uniref:CCHC-type domain-containing protein n=1 Tax=Gasterosteus aculeatus TaxID=69293 RepID=G3Q2K6_GASAC